MSNSVQHIEIDSNYAGQRLDNYLLRVFKGVPKSRIYKAIRKGEVRVNRSRIKAEYRLCAGDQLRLPPLRQATKAPPLHVSDWLAECLLSSILYEDERIMVINKPANIPVHGGTGQHSGVVEALRQLRPELRFLELAHRLDKGTSGCLMLAKKRSCLNQLHRLLRERQVKKEYLALLAGPWNGAKKTITAPLLKNIELSGERVVRVDARGKESISHFYPLVRFKTATLVRVRIITGRTHQIRVHASHLGHPVLGDEKYGDRSLNQQFAKIGLKRMFLHSASIVLKDDKEPLFLALGVPFEKALHQLLSKLRLL